MAEQEELTIADDDVLSKYKEAGTIVNKVLNILVTKCVSGASVRDICIEGDKLLEEETKNVYKQEKKMKKGIAFPVCLAVNNCINHYSPLRMDEDTILKDEDLVKFDFGAHIDGYIAVVGHTLVVGASQENKVDGRKADVILAARKAMEAALKLVKPGNNNYQVTDMITKIAESYKCKPIEGMLSFQLQKDRIDGEKTIVQNPTTVQRKDVEKCDFEVNEVYGIDILISTGEGKGKEKDTRITIYRKTDEVYSLKLKTSREFYGRVHRIFGNMPFCLRNFDDEKRAKMGVVECLKHGIVEQYPVVWEKPNEYVAQFKYTVLLKPSGPIIITGLDFNAELFSSEHVIEDPEILKVLESSEKKKNIAPEA